MANYRDIKGLSVVALAEGKKVGQIEDLVVDPEARAVRWLRLGSGAGSLFGGGNSASWVPVSAVHSVGEHAVTINSQSDVQEADKAPDAADMARTGRALLGKKVLSEDGTFLGEARDFKFDPESFRLTSLVVSQGNSFTQQREAEIDARSLMTIGEDLIVVKRDAQLSDLPVNEAEAGQADRTARADPADRGNRRPAGEEERAAGQRLYADYPETGAPAPGRYAPEDQPPLGPGRTQVYDDPGNEGPDPRYNPPPAGPRR